MLEWKKKAKRIEQLRGSIAESLYDMAKLMGDIYDDADWWAEMQFKSPRQAEDWLTNHGHLQGLISFSEIRELLRKFPDHVQWAEKSIATMREELYENARKDLAEQRRQARKQAEPFNPVTCDPHEYLGRKVVSPKVLNVAVQKMDYAVNEVEKLKQRIAELTEENKQLREKLVKFQRASGGVTQKPAGALA